VPGQKDRAYRSCAAFGSAGEQTPRPDLQTSYHDNRWTLTSGELNQVRSRQRETAHRSQRFPRAVDVVHINRGPGNRLNECAERVIDMEGYRS
jgi:hypothetical protein